MDSASFCGDTSALTLVMSQLNSNAYSTLAMASLEQRGVEGAGTVRRRRASGGAVASPGIHGALHRQGGEDLLSHGLLGCGGRWALRDSALATTSGKSPENWGEGRGAGIVELV